MKITCAIIVLAILLPSTSARVGEQPKVDKKKKKKHHKQHGPFQHHKRGNGAEARIIGGEAASPYDFPYFVDWDYCGATLIYEDIVMTAGHCLLWAPTDIYVGAYFEESMGTGKAAEHCQVEKYRLHPEYDDWTAMNDIALLKLSESSAITPVKLNTDPNVPAEGEELVAIGHGVLNDTILVTPPRLHKVTIPHIAHDDCASMLQPAESTDEDDWFYDDYALPEVVEEVMFCAGLDEGGKDSCYGDSGGPLLTQDGVQVGITSWGPESCGMPNKPGVYARVSAFADWIDETICELSDNPPHNCPKRNPDDKVTVRVDITFDWFPEETGWSISQDGTEIASRPVGSNCVIGLISEHVYLDPGEYTFTLTDDYGDGIEEGSYAIYAEADDDDEQLLVEGDGVFTDSVSSTFVVPDRNSAVGRDSPSDAMVADETVAESACAWLRTSTLAAVISYATLLMLT